MTTNHGSDSTSDAVDGFLGKVKRALGWATADRRVEAEGALEELDADGHDHGSSSEAAAEEALDEAELHVRNDHGDLAPGAVPEDQPWPADPKTGG